MRPWGLAHEWPVKQVQERLVPPGWLEPGDMIGEDAIALLSRLATSSGRHVIDGYSNIAYVWTGNRSKCYFTHPG